MSKQYFQTAYQGCFLLCDRIGEIIVNARMLYVILAERNRLLIPTSVHSEKRQILILFPVIGLQTRDILIDRTQSPSGLTANRIHYIVNSIQKHFAT